MAAASIEISEVRKTIYSMDERLRIERVVVVTRHNRGAFAMVDLDTLRSLIKTLDTLGNPATMQLLRDSIAHLPVV